MLVRAVGYGQGRFGGEVKLKKNGNFVTLESGAASKFMSIVTDHILFKKLLRLPQCSTMLDL